MKTKNMLVTGLPGCGKSTLIIKVSERLNVPISGFVTREIREGGKRVGFLIDTFDGQREILAHVDVKSPFRVGKYGVRIEVIDKLIVPSMFQARPGGLVVIDEIGKMECMSARFRKVVVDTLDSSHHVLASMALKKNEFMKRICCRPDVSIFKVTTDNRDHLAETLVGMIRFRDAGF